MRHSVLCFVVNKKKPRTTDKNTILILYRHLAIFINSLFINYYIIRTRIINVWRIYNQHHVFDIDVINL